jgi:hypothetical protein
MSNTDIKERYNKYIYNRIVLQHPEWKTESAGWLSNVELNGELEALLDEIYRKYNWHFHENARANIQKFRLWRIECGLPVNDSLVYAATYFVLYCCLVDKIMDSRNISQEEKKALCEELQSFWNDKSEISGAFPQVSLLGMRMKAYLFFSVKKTEPRFSLIVDKINRAFASECFISTHTIQCFSTAIPNYNLTDKSVEFVSASFWIAAYDATDKKMEILAQIIGEIFWLIDDICDFMPDLEDRTINSALLYCTDTSIEMSIDERVNKAVENMEMMIQKLETNVNRLKNMATVQFSNWIMNELWIWTADIRRAEKLLAD